MVPWIFALNCVIFLASVFAGCYSFTSHADNVFNSPAQIVTIRFAFIFILTAVSFFFQFLSTELTLPSSPQAIVHDMVEDVITGVVEAIMLLSFFFMLVVHVGGTDRAVHLFAESHETRGRASTMTMFTPPSSSPVMKDKAVDEDIAAKPGLHEYMRCRNVILAFVYIRPVVSIVMVVNRWLDNWELRMAMASVNILITLAAVAAILVTIRRILPAMQPQFQVLGKFFVIKGLLLVRSFQWAVYCLLVTDHNGLPALRKYFTMCSIECLFFCLIFTVAFRPATFRRVDGFPGMSFMGVWDVAMHPIPPCHDSKYASPADSKVHHMHV
ncbi:hypothetical protein B5M09_003946 [Aphanomyces astaci]|nr:hypothetical protein B5M09_003946 [Aphanomyces astaci]